MTTCKEDREIEMGRRGKGGWFVVAIKQKQNQLVYLLSLFLPLPVFQPLSPPAGKHIQTEETES